MPETTSNAFSKNAKIRIFKNFLSLSTLKGFQLIIPLITLPYLINTLGVENFGILSFSTSLSMYSGVIIQFGFSLTATREIAIHQENSEQISEIYSSTLVSAIILAGIAFAGHLSIILMFEKFDENFQVYVYSFCAVALQGLFPIWLFQGIEKMKYITVLNIASSILYLIMLLIIVKEPNDFTKVPQLQIVTAAMTLALAIYVIKRKLGIKFTAPTTSQVKQVYTNGQRAFLAQLAPNFYNNSAIFILGLVTNNSIVGIYSASTKIIDVGISLGYILSSSFYPYLCQNIQHHKYFRKLMFVIGAGITALTFMFANEITSLLFENQALEIAPHVQHLSISIILVFIILIYGNNYLMIKGYDNLVKNISIYTSLTFFIISIFAIPKNGITGAISVLIGARTAIATIQFIYYYKIQKGEA